MTIYSMKDEPTYWVDKMGFPNRKKYEELLEEEDKQDQIFSFSWDAIIFLLICLIVILGLLFFVK